MGEGDRTKMRRMRGNSTSRMQGRGERYEHRDCATHSRCTPCIDHSEETCDDGLAQGLWGTHQKHAAHTTVTGDTGRAEG